MTAAARRRLAFEAQLQHRIKHRIAVWWAINHLLPLAKRQMLADAQRRLAPEALPLHPRQLN